MHLEIKSYNFNVKKCVCILLKCQEVLNGAELI